MPPRVALCFCLGVLSGLCLLFAAFGPAVFVLLAPALALILREKGAGRALCLCAALCVGMCAGAYSVGFSMQPTVAPKWVFWVNLSAFLGACTLHGAVLTAFLWCGARLPLRGACKLAAMPILWVFAEWLCALGPLGSPMLRLCLALWRYPVLIQAARGFGGLFVSALVMAVNLLLARALCLVIAGKKDRRAMLPFATAVSIFALNLLYGALTLAAPLSGEARAVAAIQPGQPPAGQGAAYIHDTSLQLAREAAKARPSLLVTPESSTPLTFYYDAAMQAQWGGVARESEGELLLGGAYTALWDALQNRIISPRSVNPAQAEERLADGAPRYSIYSRSAAYLFGTDGKMRATYQKRREVPLFETGRAGKPLQWRGARGSGLLVGARTKVGVLICFESLFPSMARDAVNEGAQLLAVTTNDARFGADAAKQMHLAHGVFRAVETGRPLIQAGRNGYTAAVDARGRLVAALPLEGAGVLRAALTLTRTRTPYCIWGDGWLFLCAAACALVCITRRFIGEGIWKRR